jgi:hypothetical protein
MERLVRGQFVLSDELRILGSPSGLEVSGSLECAGRIRIDVMEIWSITYLGGVHHVSRDEYSLNASLGGVGNILRHDSPHPDHNREHHVHSFDVLRGDLHGSVELIYEEDRIPTLYEFVAHVEEWYYAHLGKLPSR